MSARDDDSRSARQIARSKVRKAGDRSARIATQLMKLRDPSIKKLELADELREELMRARAVTSLVARRRAERTLAGELRHHDLVALAKQLDNLDELGNDVAALHRGEHWRARMIAEGTAALAEFPATGDDDAWPRLIAAAQRERDTGKPPGAGRALFRAIVEALKAHDANTAAEAEGAEADSDDESGDDE